MTWTETHRRWQALAEIEALANAADTDKLPWNAEYAEIFGDRDALVAALRYRWELTRHAQLDTHLSEDVFSEQRQRLIARNTGVLRLIQAHARNGSTVSTIPTQRAGSDLTPAQTRVPA